MTREEMREEILEWIALAQVDYLKGIDRASEAAEEIMHLYDMESLKTGDAGRA